jgi:seryl-tRNA synthetase
MQVYKDQDALHRAVNDIRGVKNGIAAALQKTNGKPNGAALAAEANALLKQAAQIEAVLMQVNIKGSEANLNFPGMLNEQIYSFSGLLDDADTAPNAQEIETYAAMHARLGAQLDAWSDLRKTRVAAFCAQAQKAGAHDLSSSCP